MGALFTGWRGTEQARLKGLALGLHPKELVEELGEGLLAHYEGKPLVDHYAVYQHLLDYWSETMQDDAYLIASDGWKADTYRIIETDKKGKQKDKGWTCDLVPKELIIARYFQADADAVSVLQSKLEADTAVRTELEEEHGGEDGLFSELEKVNKGGVNARLKELKGDPDGADEEAALKAWIKAATAEAAAKKAIKTAESALDAKALAKYPELTEAEVKTLVVDDKWLATLSSRIHGELDRISQQLTHRVMALADRYETPLPKAANRVGELQSKVDAHLKRMGFAWN
jgi:type I restriction enzyme M protein